MPLGVFDPGDPGGVAFPADGQVPQFTHPAAFVVINGFSLDLTEKEFPQYPDLDLFHEFPSLGAARHKKKGLPRLVEGPRTGQYAIDLPHSWSFGTA